MNICIVGSGNIAHALIALLGHENEINILSSSFFDVNEIIGYTDGVEKFRGTINTISSDPKDVIPESEMIIFTVPAFVRKEYLLKIKDYIDKNCYICSLPGIGGFDEEVKDIFGNNELKIISAQRVPCISRIIKKGESVNMTLKDSMFVATNIDKSKIKLLLENIFKIRIKILDDFMEVNLSNSNPILHSARLYSLFKNYKKNIYYKEAIPFYENWNDEASEILLQMDEEFMKIVDKLNLKNVKSLKEHYEIRNTEEMTNKIRSINAFKGVYTPMIQTTNGYIPNFDSRYFTEDINIGLKYIIDVSEKIGLNSSFLKHIYEILNHKYFLRIC